MVTPAGAVRKAVEANGLELHSTFTGLAAYSSGLLLHPDPDARTAARIMFHRAIAFTERVGGVATGGHIGAFAVADWADPDARRQRWDDLRAALRNLAARCAEGGARVSRRREPGGGP